MKFRTLVFILLLGLLANSFGQEIKGKDDDSEESEGPQKGSYKMTPGLLMEPYRNRGQTVVGGSSQTNSQIGGKYS